MNHSPMEDVWARLKRELTAHVPGLAASLRPGVTEAALGAFEEVINRRLPPDVREAYLQCDGQESAGGFLEVQNALGLFGLYRWLSLSESLSIWQLNLGGFEEEEPYTCDDQRGAWNGWAIRPWTMPPPQWIPLAERRNPTMHLYVDLLPGPDGAVGQLVGEDVHGPAIWLEAASIRAYLTGLAEGLERGTLVVFRDPHVGNQTLAYRNGDRFKAFGYNVKPYQTG